MEQPNIEDKTFDEIDNKVVISLKIICSLALPAFFELTGITSASA